MITYDVKFKDLPLVRTVKELIDKRTRHGKVFLNSDGTTTVQTSVYSINYFDGQVWQDIDTTIRSDNTDPNYTNSMLSNNFKVKLQKKAENQAVTFSEYGQSVTYLAEGMNNITGVVYGNTITYPNAWQSTDLEYLVLNDQLKMELHLADNKAPKKFIFELKLKGVKTKLNGDGSIDFVDKNGKVNFRIPQMWVQDNFSNSMRYDKLKVNVNQKGNKTFIEIVLDDSGLNYPIVIDPTTSIIFENSSMNVTSNTISYGYDSNNRLIKSAYIKDGFLFWSDNLFDDNGNLLRKAPKSRQINYLTNPSFETGMTGWGINNATNGTTVIDINTSINGNKSLKVTRSGGGDQYQFSGYDFESYIGGRSFTVSAFIKTAGMTGNGARITTYWQDSTGSWIWQNNVVSTSVAGTTDWTKVSTTAIAPALAQSVIVIVTPEDINGQGTYWLDSLSITENQVAPNLLANASFETGVAGWEINNATNGTVTDTNTVLDGHQALKVTRASGGNQFQYARYDYGNYIGGRSFTVSAYIKTVGITGNGACITTYWQDTSGAWIWQNNVISSSITGTTDWTKVSATAIAPVLAQRVIVLVTPGDLNGQGTYWLDSLSITENQAATNILTNPSFETGLTGWGINNATNGTAVTDSSIVLNGIQSLKVTRATGGDQFQYAGINLGNYIGARIFTVSAYIKTVGITGNGVHITTYWQDATGAWIWQNNVVSTTVAGTTDWTKVSATGIAPALAQRVILIVTPGDLNGQGTYWLDSLAITENRTASNFLTNPGMEAGMREWGINNATNGTEVTDSNTVIDGNHSLKVTRATGGDQYQYTGYNFGEDIGGKSFSVSAYIKTAGITGNGVHITMYWQNAEGAWIWQNNVVSASITGTIDWIKVIATGIAPALAQRAYIIVGPGDLNGQGTYWIDSAVIAETQ